MSCGQIHIRSRIKRWWNQFYLWCWRDKYGYFHCNHCCVGCQFFDVCMDEFIDREAHPDAYANGEGYYQVNDGPYNDDKGWTWVSATEAYGGSLEDETEE